VDASLLSLDDPFAVEHSQVDQSDEDAKGTDDLQVGPGGLRTLREIRGVSGAAYCLDGLRRLGTSAMAYASGSESGTLTGIESWPARRTT